MLALAKGVSSTLLRRSLSADGLDLCDQLLASTIAVSSEREVASRGLTGRTRVALPCVDNTSRNEQVEATVCH
jgi:hypothetical protein